MPEDKNDACPRKDFTKDPMPKTPGQRKPGETDNQYDERCGPFIDVDGESKQKSYVEWLDRNREG